MDLSEGWIVAYEMIRWAAFGLLLFVSAFLLRRHPRNQAARVGALFSFCMAVYLTIPFVSRYTDNRYLLAALLFAAFSNSFLLWMFCRSLFSERARITQVHVSLWGASQLVSYIVFFKVPAGIFEWGARFPEFEFVRRLLPHGFYLGFILAAIVASQKEGRSDLVSSRIRLRRAFLAVAAFYGLLICAAEIMLQGQPASQATDTIHHFILLVLTTLFLLEARSHPELFPDIETNAQPVPEPSPLQKELTRWMDVEKVYRQEGLTIGQLALKLKTQEHLLRACINKELGFRNFNDFLNRYRVREACQRLRSEPTLPILNLSLEIGYRSLAPFNRAFKTIVGKTPSQYRE